MDVGQKVKVRIGYVVFIGAVIYNPGDVIEVTKENFKDLEMQKHKLEDAEIPFKPVNGDEEEEEKVSEEPTKKRGRPKREDKMVRNLETK